MEKHSIRSISASSRLVVIIFEKLQYFRSKYWNCTIFQFWVHTNSNKIINNNCTTFNWKLAKEFVFYNLIARKQRFFSIDFDICDWKNGRHSKPRIKRFRGNINEIVDCGTSEAILRQRARKISKVCVSCAAMSPKWKLILAKIPLCVKTSDCRTLIQT